MPLKKVKKISSSNFTLLLGLTLVLLLSFFLVNSRNQNYDLNGRASENVRSVVGTLISSSGPNCNLGYTYSILSSSNLCTPIVASFTLIEGKLGERVKVEGSFKNGVFYVSSLTLSGSNVKNEVTSKPIPSIRPIVYPTIRPEPDSTPVKEIPPPID